MREVLVALLLLVLLLGDLYLLWKLKAERERRRLRRLHNGDPIELRTAPSCDFCGGDYMGPITADISPLPPNCSIFKLALQYSPLGTPVKSGFLWADEAVLRRNILEIDPSTEMTLTTEQCAPTVFGYRVEVRRPRSFIKSVHKE